MRFVSALLLLALLARPALAQPDWYSASVESTRLDPVAAAQKMHLDPHLRLMAAFELKSSVSWFGGLSALLVEGDRLLTVSDRGILWRATMTRDALGQVTGFTNWQSVALARPRGLAANEVFDSEGMTRDRAGNLVISLERVQGLAVYDFQTLEPVAPLRLLPPPLDGAPRNEGPEGLTTWPDGRLLVVEEGLRTAPNRYVAAILGGRAPELYSYYGDVGFQPSDAARLDDQLFILSRRFSLLGGFAARLRQIDLDAVRARLLTGRELAVLDQGEFAENFEGVSAQPAPGGTTDLYLISDDNFFPLQRTLLLQFRLDPGQTKSATSENR